MFNASKRSNGEQVRAQSQKILESHVFPELLQDIPNVLMILNENRQVVYMNRNPVEPSEAIPESEAGSRPGECLGCINLEKGALGCGSSPFCKVCGFNKAISRSERGLTGRDECNIALRSGASLTLSVTTRPFRLDGEQYVFCALEDISEKKRREMLENIFLHDIMNNAAILQGLGDAYENLPDDQIKKMLQEVAAGISEEVQSYRLIVGAETQTLQPNYEKTGLRELAEEVIRSLRGMHRFSNRKILTTLSEGEIVTERTLLRRVLINMLKNALEAGNSGDITEVQSHYHPGEGKAVFTVRNQQEIPAEDQLKLFQKSFSTKGMGRGWGTYSIKVLTEKYLRGKVRFFSAAGKGTVFSIELPSLESNHRPG